MTVATVKAVAERFLASDVPEVLVIKGAWGVGKTFAWNQLVQQNIVKIKLEHYCYVSLFGLSSIAELRTAIFAKTRSINLLGKKLNAETVNKEWARLSLDALKSLGHRFSHFKELPYLKNVSIGFEALAPHLIRNTIICLDDFERLNPAQIKHEELLGFISELKEEKKCKIVLIFNEDKLKTKDVYREYREKVVDIELMFAPTPEEAANLALSSQMLCRDLIRKYAVSLGITNIRILRKIVNLTELIHKEVSTLHSGVTEQAVMTLVLLVWCLYDSDEKKPTLEFILEWNRLMWGFDEIKEEDPTRAGWVKVLQSYGLTGLDEFDQTIIKVIQRGYLEETGFLEEANKLDAQIRANELEQSFTKAWGLFHDTFTNNEAELVNALAESFRKSVLHISPLNLNGTTRLLRQLGHGDIADELIDFYIEHRTQEVDLFNLADNPFSSDITDPAILERFNAKHSSFKPTLTIADAISYIATNSGFSNIHTEPLMKATEEDYYALFKIDHGEALSRIVKSCLQFDNWNDDKKSIGIKARSALVRIGKESPLNAIRVRRYGITNEDLTDAAKPAAN